LNSNCLEQTCLRHGQCLVKRLSEKWILAETSCPTNRDLGIFGRPSTGRDTSATLASCYRIQAVFGLQRNHEKAEMQIIKAFLAISLALHLSVCLMSAKAEPPQSFDLVITNGHIIDGSGSPWYSGDVGIRDGRIAAIGNLSEAKRTHSIDARGMVVAPGFIDMLGQSELTILIDARLPSKIYQGITTEITGEGGSAAPLNDAVIRDDRETYEHLKITPDWRTLRQYLSRLERQGLGINLATYVGATQVRRMILGDADIQPTPAQLDQMKVLVRYAMQDGAVGVSTALEYAPAPYAKTEEIIALAAEASKVGGIYATHMRNESDSVLTAIDEAVRIGREAQIPVEIWHLKVAGKGNWGRMPEVVAKINGARAQGVDVTADTYAYTAWLTRSLLSFRPGRTTAAMPS